MYVCDSVCGVCAQVLYVCMCVLPGRSVCSEREAAFNAHKAFLMDKYGKQAHEIRAQVRQQLRASEEAAAAREGGEAAAAAAK